MQFSRIEIQNFGTIGNVTLQLQGRGLVLVTGLNRDTPKADSNGAGKSLLLDAFCWAVWGRTIREDKDDDVVNRRVGKNCQVSAYFTDAGKEFQVTRYRKSEDSKKPNDLELFLDGVDICGPSMKQTQEVVNGVMGLTFDTFCALMPGAGKNAAQMTDSDIKDLLENMLQITALAKARQETKKRLDVLIPEINKMEQEAEALDNQIQRDMTRRDGYITSKAEFHATVEAKAEVLASSWTRAIDRVREADKLLAAGKAASLDLVEISTKKALLADESASRAQRRQDIEDSYHGETSEIRLNNSALTGELKVRNAEIAKVSELGPSCEACLQDVSEDHRASCGAAAQEAAALLQSQLESGSQRLLQLGEERSLLLVPILRESAELEASAAGLAAQAKKRHPTVEKSRLAAAQLAGLKAAVIEVEAQQAALKAEENPYEALIAQVDQEIRGAEGSVREAAGAYNTKSELLAQLEFWKKAFSPSGIRSYILDNVTPVLNKSAEYYSDLLTGGEMSVDFSTKTVLKSGETREKFSVNIRQAHGGSTYKSNSRGERQRANLVTAFALSDLAELHSSKRVDFRFLDEPFEGIDESGTDAVVSLLKEQQSRYGTVFVVTHQSHFKEVFPVEIKMVKEGGMSHLEE